jgi:hypothetical protein
MLAFPLAVNRTPA